MFNRFLRHSILPALALMATLSLVQCQSKQHNSEYYLLAGTYTNTGSKGIYVYTFNTTDGTIKEVSTMDGITNPSYLTVSGNNVYAVSETGGSTPGSLSAYRFDREKGTLTFLNNQPTGGDDPCYVEADKSGKLVAVANYSGGSVTLFKTLDDGRLAETKQVVQHTGGSVNPDRQKGPHAHQSIFSPDQKFLLVPDLGKDRVMIYKVDKDAENPLTPAGEIECEPGSGPRHLAFHPTKSFAYVIHELNPVVTVYQYQGEKFTKVQDLPTWPSDFEGAKDGAEIKVSPDGKFLYISNRADQNTIGIYEINPDTGKLTNKGFQAVNGRGPRDFEIDPSGNYLLVANQQSNNIVTFKIDKKTGLLTEVGNLEVPIPVCLKFTEK